MTALFLGHASAARAQGSVTATAYASPDGRSVTYRADAVGWTTGEAYRLCVDPSWWHSVVDLDPCRDFIGSSGGYPSTTEPCPNPGTHSVTAKVYAGDTWTLLAEHVAFVSCDPGYRVQVNMTYHGAGQGWADINPTVTITTAASGAYTLRVVQRYNYAFGPPYTSDQTLQEYQCAGGSCQPGASTVGFDETQWAEARAEVVVNGQVKAWDVGSTQWWCD